MKIEVELDVFSGKPNPRWTLDQKRADEVLNALKAESPTTVPATAPARLGYRGFILHIEGGDALTSPEVRIFGSLATVGSGKSQRHLVVPTVEKLLLESAEAAGHKGLFAAFRSKASRQ
jgi:hypothetical protein